MSQSLRHLTDLATRLQQEAPPSDDGLTGFTGFVADVIARIGELGVGALVFLETVFPRCPARRSWASLAGRPRRAA